MADASPECLLHTAIFQDKWIARPSHSSHCSAKRSNADARFSVSDAEPSVSNAASTAAQAHAIQQEQALLQSLNSRLSIEKLIEEFSIHGPDGSLSALLGLLQTKERELEEAYNSSKQYDASDRKKVGVYSVDAFGFFPLFSVFVLALVEEVDSHLFCIQIDEK